MDRGKPNQVIAAKNCVGVKPHSFVAFTRKPVNYFSDFLNDSEEQAPEQIHVEEYNAKLEQRLAEERVSMKRQYEQLLDAKYQEGLAKGKEDGDKEYKRGIELMTHYSELLVQQKQELIERCEKEAVELAFEIAKKIIGHELDQRPDTVVDIARQAVQQVLDSDKIVLRVNPEDLGYLKYLSSDTESLLSYYGRLDLVADATLERGGCVLETDRGILDARLSAQFETLRANLSSENDHQTY